MRPVDSVDPIEVGQVRIKQAQVVGRGPLLVRHWWTMLSRAWTPVLPIYCWLIDHPEGTILVDTGPNSTDDWWYPTHHVYYPLSYRTRVRQGIGLEAGLEERGLETSDIDAIVLTHCHPDHAEGLELVPDPPVYLEANEAAYAHTLQGRFWGSHPSYTPSRERAKLVSLSDKTVGPFDRSADLPGFPGVSLVATPGHTANHCSVVVDGNGPTVLLAGDACLSLDQLESGRVDGVATQGRAGRETLDRIDQWRSEEDVVVLPSHDERGVDELQAVRRSKQVR
ncbi:N-acyl homoserine lactonase family protein [Natrialbaceae archaeon A-CW3]